MGRQSCQVEFSTVSAGTLTQHAQECPIKSGQLSFAIGDLRGGAATPLQSLQSSIRNQRRLQIPAYELAKALSHDKVEKQHKIVKVQSDGRCMFRALAKGLAHNQGGFVTGELETQAADELRMAVHDAICRSAGRRKDFPEVQSSIDKEEGGRNSYCKRLQQPDFWGGEIELLVLSKMLHVPLYVYRTADEAGLGNFGFVPMVKYGEQFEAAGQKGAGRRPVRLLYGNGNHYDLML